MTTARDVLNRLRWGGDRLPEAVIYYIHRGAPGDTMVMPGSDILRLGRSFFATSTATIPYHRIRKIMMGDEVIFLRKEKT